MLISVVDGSVHDHVTMFHLRLSQKISTLRFLFLHPPHSAPIVTIFTYTMPLKSVLITGCSAGGIGFALAQEFQKRNFHVFATARDPSKMSQLDKKPHVTLITLDVTSLVSVQKAVEIVRAHTGGTLDCLINNAGQTIMMPVLDFDMETAKAMYDINMWGMVRATQGFVPLLIAAKGTLVSISSVSTGIIIPWMGESTSKYLSPNSAR